MKKILSLFAAFFKIGLFTFGGGYAMVAVIERDLVEKKKWISSEEFSDVIAIAESTPGPLAINSATYIGYKVGGFLGSVFATLGAVLPSLTIIYVISLFFNEFLGLEYVGYAFRGIQACVAYLVLSAGIKMLKQIKKTVFNVTLVCVTVVALIVTDLFALGFSTIYFILIGGLVGLAVYFCKLVKKRTEERKQSENNVELPAEQDEEKEVKK